MTDFWLAVLLTVSVSLLSILADWLASRLITMSRTLRLVESVVKSGLSAADVSARVKSEIDRYRSSRAAAMNWGADLAAAAVSMDFAALGLWIKNPSMFPFFSSFNTDNAAFEIPVWLIVIILHVALLIGSLAFKHHHSESTATILEDQWAVFPSRAWCGQNGYMLAANSIGFITLLSSVVAITDAL